MTSTLLPENFIQKIRITSKILKAVDHRLRQRMLEKMEFYGALNAEALSSLLNIKPSLVNHHLDILRKQEIINLKLEGKQFFYSVNHNRIRKINNFVRCINDLD